LKSQKEEVAEKWMKKFIDEANYGFY
jgi:hypothetical protein